MVHICAIYDCSVWVVIDGAEEYRVEPGSERNAGDQTNIFPVDGGRGDQVAVVTSSCKRSPPGGNL